MDTFDLKILDALQRDGRLTNNELALYTLQRTFLLNGLHTTAGDEKIWERLMETSAIFGVSPERFVALLRQDNLLFYLFLNEYGDQSFDSAFRNDAASERRPPLDVRARMTAAYKRMLTVNPTDIASYMDYALVGPREEARAPFVPLKNMEKAYAADGVTIYKIIKL